MYKCDKCEKEFKNQRGLNSHLKVHKPGYKKTSFNIPEVKCNFCNIPILSNNVKKHENSCIKNPLNYKECPVCDKQLKLNQKFCSSSCAAKYNNITRTGVKWTSKTKEKANLPKPIKPGPHRKLFEHTCTQCKKFRLVNYKENQRKTCSRECQIIASTSRTYRNGSRKTTKYFNKNQNKIVTLESSWEVKTAELLDKLSIEWIRPKPMKWIDKKGKTRMYYPDFYLPNKNIYLDPKNPYCMELDEYKMSVVSKDINIIFGDINIILEYIQSNHSESN